MDSKDRARVEMCVDVLYDVSARDFMPALSAVRPVAESGQRSFSLRTFALRFDRCRNDGGSPQSAKSDMDSSGSTR